MRKYSLLLIFLSLAALFFVPRTLAFTDVPDSRPDAVAINWLQSLGVASGYSDGSFHPDDTIDTAAFLKIVVLVVNAQVPPNTSKKCFTDVDVNSWVNPYACSAKSLGINGNADGTMRAAEQISYARAAAIIEKILQVQVASNPIWFIPYLQFLNQMNGTPAQLDNINDMEARGQALLTRGEMAQLCYNLRSVNKGFKLKERIVLPPKPLPPPPNVSPVAKAPAQVTANGARPGGGFLYHGDIYTLQLSGGTYDEACGKIKDDNGKPMVGTDPWNDPWSANYTASKELANLVEPQALFFISPGQNGHSTISGCNANTTNGDTLCQESARLYPGRATTSTCTQCGVPQESPLHSADNQIIRCKSAGQPTPSTPSNTPAPSPSNNSPASGSVSCVTTKDCAPTQCLSTTQLKTWYCDNNGPQATNTCKSLTFACASDFTSKLSCVKKGVYITVGSGGTPSPSDQCAIPWTGKTSTPSTTGGAKTPGQVCDNGGQCASGNCNRDDQGVYRCSCTAVGIDYASCKTP